MSWALQEDRTSRAGLIEYEARLNQLIEEFPITACCQYDARRFDGATIMDILSVRPMMIVRGQIVKNPYFIEPKIFFMQLKVRQYD